MQALSSLPERVRSSLPRTFDSNWASRDGGIQRHGRDAVVDQMQLVAPQVLNGGGVGRAPEESGELTDHADITGLRLRCELAHAHVVDHALVQRTDILAGVRVMALLLLRKIEADCLVPNMETESVSSHLPPELNRSPTTAPAGSVQGSTRATHRLTALIGPCLSLGSFPECGLDPRIRVPGTLESQWQRQRLRSFCEASLTRYVDSATTAQASK